MRNTSSETCSGGGSRGPGSKCAPAMAIGRMAVAVDPGDDLLGELVQVVFVAPQPWRQKPADTAHEHAGGKVRRGGLRRGLGPGELDDLLNLPDGPVVLVEYS